MRLKAFVSAGPTAPTTTTSPTSRRFRRLRSRPSGKTAAMPVPGTLGQYVSKSGGNAYHGSLYADFQNDALEATNIDDEQIARGVSGGPGLDARDVNRLQRFRDFNADVGGYLKKDKAWWYGAYRSTTAGAAIPLAARHGCHARGDGRDGQGHLPAVSTPEARRLPPARNLPAVELFHRRHEPADRDQRCTPARGVSRERVEGRVQRRRDGRALRRGTRRRLSLRLRRDIQEHGPAHCGHWCEYRARWRRCLRSD